MTEKWDLPQSVKSVIADIAHILVPPSQELDMEGIEESIVRDSSRLVFEFPPLFRFAFVLGVRLFEFLPFLFGFGFIRFSNLPAFRQNEYVDCWAKSRTYAFREMFKGIKGLVMLAYFSDRRVWKYIAYDPDSHLQERLDLRERVLAQTMDTKR